MDFRNCKRFSKSLKNIKKHYHDENLEEKIHDEVINILKFKNNPPKCCVPLFSYISLKLYKLRIGIGDKGKSGGLRVIFAHEEEKEVILFISVYRKSDRENMPQHEIVAEIVECLKEGGE